MKGGATYRETLDKDQKFSSYITEATNFETSSIWISDFDIIIAVKNKHSSVHT